MKVVFRTDSSLVIGTGHMVRCLTLADRLRADGAEVSFVCRNLPGNVIEMADRRGYRVHLLPYEGDTIARDPRRHEYERWLTVEPLHDAEQTLAILIHDEPNTDWLVVDHYALDRNWQSVMRGQAGQIMVVDDIANREHDCDLLLDQNQYADARSRYEGLLNDRCETLLGPAYALLRPEFADTRKRATRTYSTVRRLLVFFGGSDATNETMKALSALETIDRRDFQVDVVVGRVNPYREDIWDWCVAHPNLQFHENVTNMAELMAHADLAIGAGGTTTWERCCLGLPALLVAVAENQIDIAREADRAGFAIYLGQSHEVTSAAMAEKITAVISDVDSLRGMSARSMEAVDGLGAERVVKGMKQKILEGAAL